MSVSDSLGLEVPGILDLHVMNQPYHKREKQYLIIVWVGENLQVQLKVIGSKPGHKDILLVQGGCL